MIYLFCCPCSLFLSQTIEKSTKSSKKTILEEAIILTFIAYPRIKNVFFVA
jgi:hypothetical protein